VRARRKAWSMDSKCPLCAIARPADAVACSAALKVQAQRMSTAVQTSPSVQPGAQLHHHSTAWRRKNTATDTNNKCPVFYLDISCVDSVQFPQRPFLFPAGKTTPFDFPTVNLVSYTKNIIQHHQVHSNWLEIEWDKNFSFFFDPQNVFHSRLKTHLFHKSFPP